MKATLLVLIFFFSKAAPAAAPAPTCGCLSCKQITEGYHVGVYNLVEDVGVGRCGSSCLYMKDSDASMYCMCEPGNVTVEICSLSAPAPAAPAGPQGPDGVKLLYDLLAMDGGVYGAFKPIYMDHPPNNEKEKYRPAQVTQASNGAITLKAELKNNDILSGKMDTYRQWSTAKHGHKNRGYLEVRANMPAKVDGAIFKGSWPAIWMLGNGNGAGWPGPGEIDIVEMVNGNPKVVMTTHSKGHHGGNGQHPSPHSAIQMNANFVDTELIAGIEWNLHDSQIDLTWWMTWFDIGSQSWTKQHNTLAIQDGNNQDYTDFYNSFQQEGFDLLINLAEGGDMPGNDPVLVEGEPQYIVVKSAKAYGF